MLLLSLHSGKDLVHNGVSNIKHSVEMGELSKSIELLNTIALHIVQLGARIGLQITNLQNQRESSTRL